jgi:farnesyl diphosphate synthase
MTLKMTNNPITLAQLKTRVQSQLQAFTKGDQPIDKAIQYSVLNGGKCLRSLLVYTTGLIYNVDLDRLDHAAAAVELIHCYSLIHDDLPAMDNDNLRRGNPTCHIQFTEATAILAGDALQALAFEVICNSPLSDTLKVTLIHILAKACGKEGMVLGQMQDLAAEQNPCSIDELRTIHAHKTGKLITACTQIAGTIADCSDQELSTLQHIGENLGLAFQIKDDILEVESNTDQLGKSCHSDIIKNKSTYPNILGLTQSKSELTNLKKQIMTSLTHLNIANDSLLTTLIISSFDRTC